MVLGLSLSLYQVGRLGAASLSFEGSATIAQDASSPDNILTLFINNNPAVDPYVIFSEVSDTDNKFSLSGDEITVTTSALGIFTATFAADSVGGRPQLTLEITITISDQLAPTVDSLSLTSTGPYKAGDIVEVSVVFTEVVNVTGAPLGTITVGASNKATTYSGGTGSDTLTYEYEVQAGDTDTDGISIPANSLSLNGGTIKDAAGNNATLTHSSVADNSSHKVDTTAPTLSNAAGAAIDDTSASLAVDSNDGAAANTVYAVLTQSATPPTNDQVIAGEDENGDPADYDDSQAGDGSSGTQNFANATGLTAETDYFDYYVEVDAAGNKSNVAAGVGFTTDASSSAWTLSAQDATQLLDTTGRGRFTTDGNDGTAFYVATTSATPPTGAQIEAGQDNSSAAAAYASSLVISVAGAKIVPIGTLTANTAYTFHVVHKNAGGVYSNVVSSSPFTTYKANLISNPLALNGANWHTEHSTVSANAAAGPDGVVNADKLIENTDNSNHDLYCDGFTVTSAVAYEFIAYYKKGPGGSAPDVIQMSWAGTGMNFYANFNINNGTAGTKHASITSSGVDDLGGGYYRCWARFTTADVGVLFIHAFTNNNDGLGRAPSYVGSTAADVLVGGTIGHLV